MQINERAAELLSRVLQLPKGGGMPEHIVQQAMGLLSEVAQVGVPTAPAQPRPDVTRAAVERLRKWVDRELSYCAEQYKANPTDARNMAVTWLRRFGEQVEILESETPDEPHGHCAKEMY